MQGYEGIFDFETERITSDLNEVKEQAKIKNIVNNLNLYANNKEELTEIITKVLEDENVTEMMIVLSRESAFVKLFPEFYTKNENGEDVINCQQNSSYHKFGVFRHILNTIEIVGNSPVTSKWQKKILKWTMLLHDIGKPFVKVIYEDGGEGFSGHEDVSVELSKEILERFYFTEEEKKVILTLIKYHDKFLNEGEITYDNMKFLASELENDKELFYLLLDVKDADARAKNVEVYNKYKIVKNKYLEFASTYFNDVIGTQKLGEDMSDSLDDIVIQKEEKEEEITTREMDELIQAVITKKNIYNVYQPIIDIKKKKVFSYEVFTRINFSKKIDIAEFLSYTKEVESYDKVQQILLVNGILEFEDINKKESDMLFVNIDVDSYEKYINKPRIYDMMEKNKIVILLNSYSKKDVVKIKEIVDMIHSHNGYVAFGNFGNLDFRMEDLNFLNLDFIVTDISLTKNLSSSDEKKKYISDLVTYGISKNIEIIATGVEDKETLNILKNIGINLVQGYYFKKPNKDIEMLNDKINVMLSDSSDDLIT